MLEKMASDAMYVYEVDIVPGSLAPVCVLQDGRSSRCGQKHRSSSILQEEVHMCESDELQGQQRRKMVQRSLTLVTVVTEVRHLCDMFVSRLALKAGRATMKAIRASMNSESSGMSETFGRWTWIIKIAGGRKWADALSKIHKQLPR